MAENFEEVVAESLREDLGPGEEEAARESIIAGIVFGPSRAARRAATTLPDPDPAWLVETAFAIVEDGVREHLVKGSGR